MEQSETMQAEGKLEGKRAPGSGLGGTWKRRDRSGAGEQKAPRGHHLQDALCRRSAHCLAVAGGIDLNSTDIHGGLDDGGGWAPGPSRLWG